MRPAPTRANPWNSLHLKFDLWWQFTVRAVEMRHRGSYLGFLWAVVNPLLTAALYVVVFGLIFNGRFHARPDETGIDYALGVFLGLILFHVVSETLAGAPHVILGQPNLVKKVVFPVEVLPPAQLGATWFHGAISLLFFAACALVLGRGLPLTGVAWLPLVLAPLALLTLGLAWLLAALGVYFRDLTQIVPLLSQVLLWSSAIFFSPTVLERSPVAWAFLKWNPVLHTIDLARHALLWDRPLNFTRLGYTWLAGLAVFCVGAAVFRWGKRAFAEAI